MFCALLSAAGTGGRSGEAKDRDGGAQQAIGPPVSNSGEPEVGGWGDSRFSAQRQR